LHGEDRSSAKIAFRPLHREFSLLSTPLEKGVGGGEGRGEGGGEGKKKDKRRKENLVVLVNCFSALLSSLPLLSLSPPSLSHSLCLFSSLPFFLISEERIKSHGKLHGKLQNAYGTPR
jgi:hypothetical protein